ncbi:hypothetical protein D7W81_33405 [Corallococcus aberystwythensis]|uniref:Uncharacterized protein n=2 Tax=Corallococcus aberystwythensis TaxID=2316722 RepID=A0A3A8PJY5_9BACT|nr:hypothetical protein D7W81_33405 [Corallococcus aberystwythensis]
MAGAVGLLVAGRLLRRRTGVRIPESAPEEVSDLAPVAWAPTAPADGEAGSSPGWSLTHEDTAPWEDGEADGPGPRSPPPRIRRGPSGREHFWLEP